MARIVALICCISCLSACTGEQSVPPAATADTETVNAQSSVAASQAALGSGITLENFDESVNPGDDFYRYVNGTWLRETEIPADRSNFGAFTVLADEAEANLRTIIEAAAASTAAQDTDLQRVGDFYTSFMDQQRLEDLGFSPLLEWQARIDGVSSRSEMLVTMAELNRIGVQIPVGLFIDVDLRQSDQYIAYLNQSGLSLPDRDWYLSEDNAAHEQARMAYRDYIGDIMSLADYARSDQTADSVMAIEDRIAEVHWDRVQNRQRELTYNRMTLDELTRLSPEIPWESLLSGLGLDSQNVVVRQPSYVEALSGIWAEVPLDQWQDYMQFKLVDAFAPYLSNDFVTTQFNFEGRVLSGIEEMRPRWKRGVDTVDRALGEVVGRLYVQDYFQEESKQRMDQLVENLRQAFRIGIDELGWMTDETKREAQDKLEKFTTKIGYPEQWKDYSGLVVQPDDLVGNLIRSNRLEHNRELDKLGGPIDRGEWFMRPYTVNAYYNPPMNEIVFPAAILQPPFFNVAADDAVNYGGIGAVIGHEFSHGFDDQGRKSDGDGNLRDWWTEEDAQAFSERANDLVAQYEQFEVLPGQFLNGEFTLGENIGDLSGLAVAYRAYKLSLNGEEAPVIDGFTGDQRFFIGWAQVWRRLYRDENLEMRLTTDPHSHSEARCNGVLRNFDAWYEAFDIQPDDELYLPPEQRVAIW